ncbi:hypothetical protein AQUCO_00400403v1 [Aquilegia coerulea]|uniref:Uncharacterized protein n=1 Tax=Aquilegia coerulea TaxID=218851 RepID=A0A2G5EUU9_AQUCA|nr:hypothetical protein AQUCO_00400403v1 [Aquilegia coerulea]
MINRKLQQYKLKQPVQFNRIILFVCIPIKISCSWKRKEYVIYLHNDTKYIVSIQMQIRTGIHFSELVTCP